MNIRNIAIIAHVDHGKTTLVDALLRQSKTHLNKENIGQEFIMDSNELERERGITIFSKNASVQYSDPSNPLGQVIKINIIDTPGHADFGGEVERVLNMADGCLLLIDAKEGPMPQTRFVLKKELGAGDHSLDFPVIYASGRDGKAGKEPDLAKMENINPIFEAIVDHIPSPIADTNKPLQMLVTSIAADNFKGRLAIGRIYNGSIKAGQEIMQINRQGQQKKYKLTSLMAFSGLNKIETDFAQAGDIVAIAGVLDATIGETIGDPENPEALPVINIEEPTVKVIFMVNDSPFAGKEGEFCTSRQIRERLFKELETDVALRVEENSNGTWTVSGRGELHLSILIERLRREGFEFSVSRPQVIMRQIDGKNMAPYEKLFIEVPEQYQGAVMQKLGNRKGELKDLRTHNGVVFLEFAIPTKGLFGYRSEFLTDTKGLGIINTSFYQYMSDPGNWKERNNGSLVASESGVTNFYGLINVQDRGVLFLENAVPIYEGQVVGQNSRSEDIRVNVCKAKQLSNMRSKGEGSDEHFNTPKTMGLEDALEYIGDDELVEVTPKTVRIRKMYLTEADAKKAKRTS
ncbi:MAG: GTP-binding protein TypA [Parcubacteria group bacterium GW2011_GWA2_33_14]|nr:MAG: GTP-binding protein TypA [Parcubacteria group bacterium GW2011_GWA2_33_14]